MHHVGHSLVLALDRSRRQTCIRHRGIRLIRAAFQLEQEVFLMSQKPRISNGSLRN